MHHLSSHRRRFVGPSAPMVVALSPVVVPLLCRRCKRRQWWVLESWVCLVAGPFTFFTFLKKIVNAINVYILDVNITKLFFVCMCIKFNFSYFKAELVVLIKGMLRQK